MNISIDSLYNSDDTLVKNETNNTQKDSTELDKMDFLNLLCTQLKYQDPLNPDSETDMAAQLAQYSSLECMQNIETAVNDQTEVFNYAVDALQYSALSSTNAASISLIGKTVRLQQTELDYTGDNESFRVHLGNNTEATVYLLDEEGEVVKTFVADDKNDENSVSLEWDGITDTGEEADEGTYYISIEGENSDEELYCFIEGIVNGVRFSSDGEPIVKIDGNEMSIGNILEVVANT